MKQRTLKTIILLSLLCLAFSGCSWIYNLTVINDSQDSAAITYRLHSSEGIFLSKPVIYKEEEGTIISDSTDRVSYDDNIVTFILQPGERVVIATTVSSTLKRISRSKEPLPSKFNLDWLTVIRGEKEETVTIKNIEQLLTKNKTVRGEIRIK